MAGLEEKQKKSKRREKRQAEHVIHSMQLRHNRKVEVTFGGYVGSGFELLNA